MSNQDRKNLIEIHSALMYLLSAQQEILNGFDFSSTVSISYVTRLHESANKALNNIIFEGD
jgi:hypothetical protein